MPDRASAIAPFLARAGWGDARRIHLAGDASARRYMRLCQGTSRAILMDADPATGEDTRPFLRIADHLRAAGLSAPEVLAQDPGTGLLLLEDFGDALFARLCAEDESRAPLLYTAAAEMLHHLHQTPPPPDLPKATPERLTQMLDPFLEAYLPALGAKADTGAIRRAMRIALETHATDCPVLILRDFHAENLIWLPGRAGVARCGLLDFQDAMAGHPAYDLVSLLQDARRDVPKEAAQTATDRFLALSGYDRDAFAASFATLGAQRNLRILGIFVRLAMERGKPGYLELIPRVWTHLQTDLSHLALSDLRSALAGLPPPAPEMLSRMAS